MSSEALSWAFKQDVKPSGAKFTLCAMAECANYKTGRVMPSLAHLTEITGQNRKSIIAHIDQLEAEGFIRDTGEREGRTKQIKVYEMHMGIVPKVERSQKRNSSNLSSKGFQKRDTEPSLEPSPPISSIEDMTPAPVLKLVADNPEPERLAPRHVSEAWNAMCDRTGLPKVRSIEGPRERRLRSLIAKHPIEDFTEAIDAIERSPWMHGANDRGWRADFDFMLSKFHKLIEGSYEQSASR